MLRKLAPMAMTLRSRCTDGLARRFAGASTASQRVAAKRAATIPAEPATVKPYEHHLFVQLPRPADAPDNEPWWPSVIESNPALLGMFSQVAALKHEATGVCASCPIATELGVSPPHNLAIAYTVLQCIYRCCEDHCDRGCQTAAHAPTSRHCHSNHIPRRSAIGSSMPRIVARP